MPFFFLLSGYLTTPDPQRNLRCYIATQARHTMLPFYCFLILGIFAEAFKRKILNRSDLDIPQSLLDGILEMNIDSLSEHYGFVLWFLPTLFAAKTASTFLNKTLTKTKYKTGIDLLLIFALIYISANLKQPLLLSTLESGLAFIRIGSILRLAPSSSQASITTIGPAVVTIFVITFATGLPSLDLAHSQWGNTTLNTLWACSFFLIIIHLSRQLTILFPKPVEFISKSSGSFLMIYVIHPYSNNAAHIFSEKIRVDSWALKLLVSSIILCSLALVIKNIQSLIKCLRTTTSS